jgi:dTDP-4-dehydrorhamnose 3,5-epimerase
VASAAPACESLESAPYASETALPSTSLNAEQTFERLETALPGVCLLQPRVLDDARGLFWESYHESKFAALGIKDRFVQDNHSCSRLHVLRGLHYQLHRPQAKLCRVVAGEVLDVAVDIRLSSPHFGKWVSAILSAKSHNLIYIPEGFAHGFLALSDKVQFLYKCSAVYDAPDEHGISWNDPDLGIDWGISNPLLSQKDSQYLPLAKVAPELLPQYLRA